VSSWRAAAVSGGIGNGLTPEQKQKKQEKDTYIRNALNPQHIPIQIQDAKMVCNPNTQYSKFSRFHPPDSHGSWIGRPMPQKCSPPGGYRMTQTTTAISSKREIGATLLYYGKLLIHCFCSEFAVPSYWSTAPELPDWSLSSLKFKPCTIELDQLSNPHRRASRHAIVPYCMA
jgi:hypothetical protein